MHVDVTDPVNTDWVEWYADQYRTAFLLSPDGDQETEYLVWAATGGSVVSASFYWSKNDSIDRFGWDAKLQRWTPFRASSPQNLGVLQAPNIASMTLSTPRMELVIGETLPGNTLVADQYSTVRLGASPQASASRAANVLVVSDNDAANPYSFAPGVDAVVGVDSGLLQWNPTTIASDAGASVWYVPRTYVSSSTGILSPMLTALNGGSVFLAPVPSGDESPLIAFGNRTYLDALRAASDADLATLPVSPGQVGWSATTGLLKFNTDDLRRSDPDDVLFDLAFLGGEIVSYGVTCSTFPIGTRDPAVCRDSGGSPVLVSANNAIYLPLATPFTSGVVLVPDGTGQTPDPLITPSYRPNGSGLVRSIEDVGQLIIYGDGVKITNIIVVDRVEDIPTLPFRIPQGTAYISRESDSTFGSRVGLSAADRRTMAGSNVFFKQASLVPATSITVPSLTSRRSAPTYTFDGTETFVYEVDGVVYSWSPPASTMTRNQVVTALNIVAPGTASLSPYGQIVLTGTTSVSIGYGTTLPTFDDRDLRANAILGFLPGWDTRSPWNPDSGMAFGLSSALVGDVDFRTTGRFEDAVITAQVIPTPYFPVLVPPLEDVPGYWDSVFFRVTDGPYRRDLELYRDLVYDFNRNRATWCVEESATGAIVRPTNQIDLGTSGIIASSLYPAVGTGYGLYVAEEGGARVLETLGSDYVLDVSGRFAVLTTDVGRLLTRGYGASVSGSTLTDTDASFIADGVVAGCYLFVDESYYVITSRTATSVTVNGSLPVLSPPVAWSVFDGALNADPSIIADIQFNAIPVYEEDPFDVTVLLPAGVVGSPPNIVVDTTDYQSAMLRFGDGVDDPSATVHVLRTVELGTLVNGLLVPDVASDHFTEAAFDIVVGDKVYVQAIDLFPVAAFTEPLLGDVIEYGQPGSGIEGEIKFGADVFAQRSSSLVYYKETPRVSLPVGEAEIDPTTGTLNLSPVDSLDYDGRSLYFVAKLPFASSPLSGTLFFASPLPANCIVEARYFAADASGNPVGNEIVEQLAVPVRRETAVYTSGLWTYNPTGRTAIGDVTVWVNNRLQNYGNRKTVEGDGSTLMFDVPNPAPSATVIVSYAVKQTFGGEQAFQVAVKPVARKPLKINGDTFTLTGDRTGDIAVGSLLSFNQSGYVTSVVINGDGDTDVSINVSFDNAGSNAPSETQAILVTDRPITASLFANQTLRTPIVVGDSVVRLVGNVSLPPDTLLDIDGDPYRVVTSRVDGDDTDVTLLSPAVVAYPITATVRSSVRPIYVTGTTTVRLPIAGTLRTLIRFEGDVGVEMMVGSDYLVSDQTITLLDPLALGQKIVAFYAQDRVLAPFNENQTTVLPTFEAGYVYAAVPSDVLGQSVTATYSYRNPDTFYTDVVPLAVTQAEALQEATLRASASTGGFQPTFPPTTNWSYGVLSPRNAIARQRYLDRAARGYISDYNDTIVYFEQVLETINGLPVGDRDGKFRFDFDTDETYPGPGDEDPITGDIVPNYVWFEYVASINPSLQLTPTDPITNPSQTTQDPVTLVVSGPPMNPWELDFSINEQASLVDNDMDDIVLLSTRRPRLTYAPLALRSTGQYSPLWLPSALSRIYPERTLAFTTTFPGIGGSVDFNAPGQYAFAKPVEGPNGPVLASTFNKPIGNIENPALGDIRGIVGQPRVSVRSPRARVWAYSPTGFPDIDPASANRPAVVLSVVPLVEFPVDPQTGLPDLTQLAAQGGNVPDLSIGDVSLSTPPWVEYDAANDVYPQIGYGTPDGTLYAVGTATARITNAFGQPFSGPIPKGIFVDQVLSGCIVTFTDGSGALTDPNDIVTIGPVASPFEPQKGDTLYVLGAATSVDAAAFPNPPTVQDLKKFARNQPFLDVGADEKTSTFTDKSLPSFDDPAFPIKEIVNQRTAEPLMAIESTVDFTNVATQPFRSPALLGLDRNDSGDYSLPYLDSGASEIEVLRQLGSTFGQLTYEDNFTNTAAVYPNEIQASDVTVIGAATLTQQPAAFTSPTADFIPAFSTGSGVGPGRPFDLLLSQITGSIDAGSTGILSVGGIATNRVEPPRFVTPTVIGDNTKYTLDNAIGRIGGTGTEGMEINEVGPNTLLDISSISAFTLTGLSTVFDNGLHPFGSNDNVVTIRLFNPTTGVLVETITYDGATQTVTGGAGSAILVSPPTASPTVLTFPDTGFANNLGVVYDFTISIDTYASDAVNAGSDTAFIKADRLTFSEAFDLRGALARGTATPVAGILVETALDVHVIQATATPCTVNACAEVNGGPAFTFVPRTFGSDEVGDWDGVEGILRVMGVEGFGNTPITTSSPMTIAVCASSDSSATSVILNGSADVLDGTTYLQTVTVNAGDLANVEPGDVVVIDSSVVGDGAVKAGTYLVRYAVTETNANPPGFKEIKGSTTVGGQGWCDASLPKSRSATLSPFRLITDPLSPVYGSPSGYSFPSAGTLYVVIDVSDYSQTICVDFTSYTVTATETTFVLTPGSVTDATGGVLADGVLLASVNGATSYMVAGAMFLPTTTVRLVGANEGSDVGGFRWVRVAAPGGNVQFDSTTNITDTTSSTPAPGDLGVWISDPTFTAIPNVFTANRDIPVYQNVPMFLDLRGLDLSGVNGFAALTGIQPGTRLDLTENTGFFGFYALSGVFLEPTFPKPVQDLAGVDPYVVDATRSLGVGEVGMRSAAAFGLGSTESVSFEVRRIRRFHGYESVTADMAEIRKLYEIRRGDVVSVSDTVVTTDGTQFGSLTTAGVNAGDTFRDLTTGQEVTIKAITSSTVMVLDRAVTVGPFEIYLKQPIVPLEQSHEQLLSRMTDRVLVDKVAVPSTNVGGQVNVTNELSDISIPDFGALGVEPGDIVVVSPAGALAGPTGVASPVEYGARPFGDQSVLGRASYVAGSPSELDDNRGSYRIDTVGASLTVIPTNDFAGTIASPVIYGDAGQEYVVLPTIHASGLTGTTEGQNDLRLTAPANGSNSYLGNFNSIEPFSYRVIRPTSLVSPETVDLVLFMRERTLSWMEEINTVPDLVSDYYTFQATDNIEDLSRGVVTNTDARSLTGLVNVSPFENTDDCLSVLDRRYWCLDTRLDRENPATSPVPYASFERSPVYPGLTAGSGRPVLPDRIDSVLDTGDELREQRYAWIDYRANRITGTLFTIERLTAELAQKEEEQRKLARLQAQGGSS